MFPFDIFLSHNSRDKPAVEEIGRKLRHASLNPWLDKEQLIPGARWQGQLADGLRASATCGVFIGPAGFGDWAREELDVAQNRAAKEPDFRLIPILLPGLPEPFDFDSLPPFLTARTWVDFRKGQDDPQALAVLIKAIQGLPAGSDYAVSASPKACPYRGLEVFDEDHADFFFGRERDIQRVIEKLKDTRFLTVLGPSGSGKSSLVRAGVIPRLKRGALVDSQNWKVCVLRPGSDPNTVLAAKIKALNSDATMRDLCNDLLIDPKTLHRETMLALTLQPEIRRIVWVIDQFEEVFTLCLSERERSTFVENLLFASSIPNGPCMIVLAMRADFYGKCAGYPSLAVSMAAQQFLVPPMDREMLRESIVEPARRVGLQLEPGLAESILHDVENQPGSLPLLEHALLEVWNLRSGGTLTFEAYRQSGRVEGAIAKRAQAIYDNFTAEEQQVARRILLRLIQPGEGTEDTRRRASVSELITHSGEEPLIEKVIEAFTAARLLTIS